MGTEPLTQNPIPEPVQAVSQAPANTVNPGNRLVVILSVLLLIAVSIAGFFALQIQKLVKQLAQVQVQVQVQPTPFVSPEPSAEAVDPTADWKIHEDKKWGFLLKYPDDFFTACYPNEGLKLWGPKFDCSVPHDIFYTISAIGYEENDYKPYKKASKIESVTIAGRNATKNTYVFDESDGPLFGLHEETEIVIPLQSGLIQLVLLGQEAKNKVFFDQILSTFKFTN